MKWLDRLKKSQEVSPDTIRQLEKLPVNDLSKLHKVCLLDTTTAGSYHAVNGGKALPHYCETGNCWCSEKLPGSDYPSGCVQHNCEYRQ